MIAFESVFQQIAVLLIVAAALGAVLRRLHQPLIIGFIAVGVIAGPSVLGIVQGGEEIELLAHLGIALLLFIVGLKLDVRLITTLGPVALLAGLGQMALTVGTGFVLATVLGYDTTAALYLAVALTFSSTIVVVKLLSDRRQIDQLHGRIALGVLIVQDIAVVVVMIALSAFGTNADGNLLVELGLVALRGAAFVVAIAVLARFVLPRVLDAFARTPELLLLSAVAWALTLAAAGDVLGFSEEVGAFIAGVALASSPYRESIGTRLTTLRDFLLLFFFVQLGLSIDVAVAGPQFAPAIILSAFVLLGKPVFVMAIMGALGYRRRTSYFSGVSLAQISEFSLIFAALGLELGHIDESVLGLITSVAVITIAVSSYLILASRQLFDRLAPLLAVFERARPRSTPYGGDRLCPHVIVFGLGRFGGRIADRLHHDGVSVLGVDFDPQALGRAERRGLPVLYGDAEDSDLVGRLPLECAGWVVSSSPDRATNVALLHALRHHGYAGKVAVTAHVDSHAVQLTAAGADLVLRPFLYAADVACEALGLPVPDPEPAV
ncbi:MAG TPA: cation:proton antiporter family protein, partial [Candidatus Caenarcaniphilales bacterium]|nr:cation:proton antiporter family protein [Candidatus Caenarcaniphilales bacterium]